MKARGSGQQWAALYSGVDDMAAWIAADGIGQIPGPVDFPKSEIGDFPDRQAAQRVRHAERALAVQTLDADAVSKMRG